MLVFLERFNFIIFMLFTLCYAYQMGYILLSFLCKPKRYQSPVSHPYAVLIPARNEEAVITGLIESIRRQNYPADLIDIYVIADNCTDRTASVAAAYGAYVIERTHKTKIGKGYALQYALGQIRALPESDRYAGYFVFDADNLLDPGYVKEMNAVFCNGYRVVTSYRNSKNYDANWISAGYSLWFLREAKFLNNARMLLGTSAFVSGTGFLMHRDIVRQNHGWKHFLLTEDIEFSADCMIGGELIGYCHHAVLYDEQPLTLRQSCVQRLRWAKGFYQVLGRYGRQLLHGAFAEGNFSCYDMLMSIAPAMFISCAALLVNAGAALWGLSLGAGLGAPVISAALHALGSTLLGFYGTFFFMGALTLLSEWKQIGGCPRRKFLSLFTFPLFMLTYIPIALYAVFNDVEWKPVTHSVVKNIDEMQPPAA